MRKEYGKIGQNRYGGVFYEEFLPELRGRNGVQVYREMSENDETVIGKASHDGETGGAVDKIQAIATELQKADPALSQIAAVQKAWELHPELVQEYDNEYFNRRAFS